MVGFENELVDADRNGSDEKRIEFLVIFGAIPIGKRGGKSLIRSVREFNLRGRRADVGELPFQVCHPALAG